MGAGGLQLLVILIFFGLSAGVVGRIKGSSFWIWFAVGLCLPFAGTLAALFWRFEHDQPRRRCPECNNVVPVHDQVCMRCGRDLDWPQEVLLHRSGG